MSDSKTVGQTKRTVDGQTDGRTDIADSFCEVIGNDLIMIFDLIFGSHDWKSENQKLSDYD